MKFTVVKQSTGWCQKSMKTEGKKKKCESTCVKVDTNRMCNVSCYKEKCRQTFQPRKRMGEKYNSMHNISIMWEWHLYKSQEAKDMIFRGRPTFQEICEYWTKHSYQEYWGEVVLQRGEAAELDTMRGNVQSHKNVSHPNPTLSTGPFVWWILQQKDIILHTTLCLSD